MKALLLDMDGVLVDVRGSFRRAIVETVAHFVGEGPTPEQIQAKKDQGGFNNDWVLSHAFVLEAGGDTPFDDIKEHFNRVYRGDDFDGLITTEPAAVRTGTLEVLADRYALGLVTGRPEADANWTLRRHGWDALIPAVAGMDRQAGREKPDPYGLELVLEDLGIEAERAAYAGDTVDDMAAARAAGVVPIGVVPPGFDLETHGRTLMAAGAHVVVSTPDALPALLATLDTARPRGRMGEGE
ncbi:TIGR01548 family HAD-type hydrolase [Rubrivirga sp.]|uniref:TIGR01548 family HAD-type hydrolase n=1 Tax=Rubrivirga sp. TaxID=1885344 RepID=UPI003C76FE90